MTKVKLLIWGREFTLPVSYQNYPGEIITEHQQNTVCLLQAANFAGALDAVKSHIVKQYEAELGDDHLTNIFRFVMPKNILILRASESRVFALMCNYKLDIEHGLAVVFRDEQFSAVGPQDIVL